MSPNFIYFCGSPLWKPPSDLNISLGVNVTSPSGSGGLVFTECFQNTVLVWVPCAYLMIITPFYFWHLLQRKNNVIRLNWINITKLALGVVLMLLCAVTMFQRVHIHHTGGVLYTAILLAPALNFIAMAMATILIEFGRKKGIRVAGVLFNYWLMQTVAGALTLYSTVQIYISEGTDIYNTVHSSLFLLLVFTEWIFSCLVDYPPYSDRFVQHVQELPQSPESAASFLSILTFWWFTSLILLGYKKPLEKSDLWSLNWEDTSKCVGPRFEKYWKKELEKMKRSKECVAQSKSAEMDIPLKSAEGDQDPEVIVTGGKKTYQPSLMLALTKAFGLSFIFGSFLKLVYDILIFLNPVLLRELIAFTNKKSEPVWKGFCYTFLLFAVALVQSMILHQYFHRCFLVGMRLRTALTAAVYKKSLKLSSAARRISTVGEIVNLMAVDAQRFTELTTYLNLIWSGPFQICVSLYFLWLTLGPSVLAGVAVMIVLIPVNAIIAKKNRAFQGKQMVYKDSRIKLMSEILNGIKVLKLYAWEPSFEQKVLDIRKQELHVMKKAAFLNAASSFTWSCAPFIVSLVTFAVYVLSSPTNILDAEKAFVSLSLFNILRFPLAMFPTMIANIVQVSVSVKRLRLFLLNEELDPDSIHRVTTGKHALKIENGSFTWDRNDDKPTLQDLNISIKDGQLVAVVGVVGSGKSSLLSAFLGEMEKLQGGVTVKGSVAYTAQQAWIQNATLRDNILFGKEYDEETYNNILEACALKQDLDILPGGDMTEIGEKGINLSGGQKQRVSLGRAVYQNADVYLLDDPLSAVDSHVGKHIFENVIGPKGLLSKKTRVLVTHGISFLPQMDHILVLVDGHISEFGTYKQLLAKEGAFAEFLKTYLAEHEEIDDEETEESIALREEILSQLSTSPKDTSALSGSKERLPRVRRDTSRSVSSQTDSPAIQNRRDHSLSKESLHGSNKPSHHGSGKITTEPEPIANGKPTNLNQRLIKEEKSATGRVKLSLFFLYLRSMRVPVCFAIFILYTLHNTADLAANLWLSAWSSDKPINGTYDTKQRNYRLGVFGGLGLAQGLLEMLSSFALAAASVVASRHIHFKFLHHVLRCSLIFFDSTPAGRIINRFSQDLTEIDLILPFTIRSTINLFYAFVFKLGIISYTTPYFLLSLPIIGVIYFLIQRFYVAVSRQLKRLESVSRSPIYSHFGETIQGTTTIRAFGRQTHFIDYSDNAVDRNQECYFPSIVSNRWLAVRLEFVGNLIVLFASLFAVIGRDHLSAGIVGLSITYAMGITQTLNWAVRMSSELETNIVSVERVKEYTTTPTEAEWEIPDKKPPLEWPNKGEIKFNDYGTRYREGLDLVLKGITCHIEPTEKVGIVGRTGAGKSSLTMGLFRIIEAVSGEIIIDGVNISEIGLHDVRSRITIIPQDPVLFSGTLRMNLDPFDHHSDEEIWKALEHAHLKSFVLSLSERLEHVCSEGGENLSVGQRQLVCLARALLRKTKILVLDEATAAVDLETDDLIQQTVRTKFKDCTVLTIAHRINTIMDYDRVMVLEGGKIAEIDAPQNLLTDKSSLFYGLAKDAGLADD